MVNFAADVINQGRFAVPVHPGDTVVPYETFEERQSAPVGSLVDAYGFTFRLTPTHIRPAELETWRSQGDSLADAAVQLYARSRTTGSVVCPASQSRSVLDFLLACEQRQVGSGDGAAGCPYAPVAGVDASCPLDGLTSAAAHAFLQSVRRVPEWVDWDRVARGQRVFTRNCSAMSLALLHMALVGGFGAPRVNSVLAATGYLTRSRDATYKRLLETTQMTMDCMGQVHAVPCLCVCVLRALTSLCMCVCACVCTGRRVVAHGHRLALRRQRAANARWRAYVAYEPR